MKNKLFAILVMMLSTGCMEGLPSEETPPDAAVPPTQPDACPTAVVVDANVVNSADADVVLVPDATISVPDATVATPDATPPASPDAAPVPVADASVPAPDATPEGPCGVCAVDSDCNDSLVWTSDSCVSDACFHWPTDCGGMEVRVAAGQTIVGAVTCGFWGGWDVPPADAPNLGSATVNNSWMNAPTHACSVIDCYDTVGTHVRVDIRIDWNGSDFAEQLITGLLKGTWDGHNLVY